MLRSLSKIAHWGVTSELSPSFAKRIILTNSLGILFSLNMTLSTLAFLYLELYSLALFTFFFVLTEASWPVLNYYKKYHLSRLGILISSNILGFTVSIMLANTGYNHGFYVMVGVPILIFGLKEQPQLILGLLLPVILFPLSEYLQHHNPWAEELYLSASTREFIFHSTSALYLTLIFLMFFFLAKQNERAEDQLLLALKRVEKEKETIVELNSKIEEQRLRSFTSAKFAALGEMASGIGHEINNPVTIISLNNDQLKYMIQHEEFDKKIMEEKVTIISRTIARIAKIIENMKSFSREGNQDPYQSESVAKIIDDTLNFCSERFKVHQVKFVLNIPQDEMYLSCRSIQISQVLMNLLNNAFDAIEELPEKWIELDVKIQAQTVVISIMDSGTGIASSEHEKIFQPFYTTKPPGKGTGLGLSLSRSIIQQHAGKLYLDKSHAHTKFVIELPLLVEA